MTLGYYLHMTRTQNNSKIKIGNTIISTRSWTKLKIAGIDWTARMVWDKNNRAVSFDEIN